MQWKIERHLVLWGFALAAAILAFAGWESYQNTVRFSEASEWQRHTYEVLSNIDAVGAGLVDAETGQRGYLITGDDVYLEPYHTAVNNIHQRIGNVASLTSDNPNQQRRVQSLESLVKGKLAELQLTIDLRKKEGLASANRVVLEGSGKRLMDQIRASLSQMASEEEVLLRTRTHNADQSVTRSVRAVLGGTLLSISLLLLSFVLLKRELSEREKVQGALQKSEKWLSTTLSSIGDAVIATDMNGAVSFINPVAQSLTGWSLEDARGKSMDLVFDIVNKETRRPVENPVKKVFREGKVVGLADHTILLSKGGKEFDIEDSAAPILSDTGEAFGVVLVFRDITENKLAEEETKRQKDLLQLILDSIADGVVVADTNGKFVLFNAAAEHFLGVGATETTPDQWSDRYGTYLPDGVTPFPPNDLPLVRAIRGQSVDAMEVLIRNANVPDGRLLSIHGRPLKGEDGSLKGGVVVFHDMTERKRAEEALRHSEERFRLLVSEVSDYGILMLDPEGRIATWNAGAERIKGYKSEEIIGQHFSRFYPPEDVEQGKPANELKIATEQGRFEEEGWRVRKDGSRFWANVVITALRDATGRLRGFGKVTRDITERKRTEELMLQAKEQAERTSKFKDQFLSTMSHELRTPLNAVLGFSDLLADERYGPLNEKQRRYIDHIHTGGKHLLTLISDILDLSKIEAGRMELTPENLSVKNAFAEVLGVLQPLADKKSQVLATNVESKLIVRADATRFKQVLMNLLGNAIKFTPNSGRIELVARAYGDRVRVEVQDNGPGIALEEQQRIFEAFYRLQESGKKTEGTGLGLAITQRLIELHGGELRLQSDVGHGSCFYFSLPAALSAEESSPHESKVAPRSAGSLRVLVIEDDRATALLLQTQLASAGYLVTLCEEPQNALAVAAQLQPNAITLDIVMKPKNGWEILTLLKRDPRTAHIPLIVVSIIDQPSMGALLGADEYLVKPVDKSTLLVAIARHINKRPASRPGRSILVVEDDAPTREFIAEMLSGQGFVVTTAADGAQARAQVAASLPEIIILDMMLPEVSGFELLGEWRASLRTAGLTVFVLTSKDLSQEEQRYLRTHTEALLHKQQPWHEELLKQLDRVMVPRVAEKV